MTDAPLTPREADDALAAEYVLGVLDLSERAEAEARIKRDPAFAALVTDWEVRLSDLNDEYAEAPAPNLLPKIEARLFPKAATSSPAWRGGLFGWLSGAVVAASLVLAVLALVAPPQSELVAMLATPDNRLAYEVSHFGDTLQVTRVAGVPAPAGQVHELWVIAPGEGPVSLGLLQDEPLVVTYPAPPEGHILAVSLERDGGSTTGVPSASVILMQRIGDDA
ncbi:anti-sigma factor [Tabrizicola sp.]|uniref:anti-sigma factor n=1 Tax=Tabrizicola sp. TaxID=2005166 RepID=UPI003F361010